MIDTINNLLTNEPYSFDNENKNNFFLEAMKLVVDHHIQNCLPYAKYCKRKAFVSSSFADIASIPYLTTNLFKKRLILSVPQKQVHRTISSSATSSGIPSIIGVDAETSRRQTKSLISILSDRIGKERRDYILLDDPKIISGNRSMSARSSTIRALLLGSRKILPVCKEQPSGKIRLNIDKFVEEMQKYKLKKNQPVVFGFTFILYHYVVKTLIEKNILFSMPNLTILHIGGWKKLEKEKVSTKKFLYDTSRVFGTSQDNIVDIYGFTEQAGIVYPTCEYGNRHLPVWADVIVRKPDSLEVAKNGEIGLLEFLTPITTSYPGHAILTEDKGVILNIEQCECGRKGKVFHILGRAENTEIRGCSDILANNFMV